MPRASKQAAYSVSVFLLRFFFMQLGTLNTRIRLFDVQRQQPLKYGAIPGPYTGPHTGAISSPEDPEASPGYKAPSKPKVTQSNTAPSDPYIGSRPIC